MSVWVDCNDYVLEVTQTNPLCARSTLKAFQAKGRTVKTQSVYKIRPIYFFNIDKKKNANELIRMSQSQDVFIVRSLSFGHV